MVFQKSASKIACDFNGMCQLSVISDFCEMLRSKLVEKQNFETKFSKKIKNLTVKLYNKMIDTKYEVDRTLQLGYLEEKIVDFLKREVKHLNTFSTDFLHTAIQWKGISWIFRKFSKSARL